MLEKGYEGDVEQCCVKIKELKQAFQEAREANCHAGAAPKTCCFCKELDAILGGNPTSTTRSPVDTTARLEAVDSGINPKPMFLKMHASCTFPDHPIDVSETPTMIHKYLQYHREVTLSSDVLCYKMVQGQNWKMHVIYCPAIVRESHCWKAIQFFMHIAQSHSAS